MIRKSLDLPPGVAKAFVKDMQAYFAEEDGHRRDAHSRAPASRTQSAPGPREKLLGLSDVKRMFILMNSKG